MISEEAFCVGSTIIRGQVQESNPNPNPAKKRRNLPGKPDPDAEVIAMSPKSLMAKNRFVCEICKKGFQRDQNLQLHRRGHNLPWKLKQRKNKDEVRKKVYVCPEKTCVHHDPCRALGDLTGIKKHYSRKHGEKKWKCDKCSKKYAVHSDWKAHTKICGTRDYKCHCGTLFSRKDSFITHRAFCDAIAEGSGRTITPAGGGLNITKLRGGSDNIHLSNVQLVARNMVPQILPAAPGFHPELEALTNFVDSSSSDPGGQKVRLPLWLDNCELQQYQCSEASISNSALPNLAQTMNMFGSSPQAQALLSYRYPPPEAAPFTSMSSDNLSALVLPHHHGLKQEQHEENNNGDNYLLSHPVVSSLYNNTVASFFSNNNKNTIAEVQKLLKQAHHHDHSNNLNGMLNFHANNDEHNLGLTRDFLGVGQEFNNAMGSVMDYGGNY